MNQSIKIDISTWEIPPIFTWLAQAGDVNLSDMFNTFNMGIGYALVVPPSQVKATLRWFTDREMNAWEIGGVINGDRELLGIPE